ncbi:probable E3 ubiquitin-protein ligase HERC1, partial [Nilaparvata lugens]|uniref:probable E3 ubiquitin-protein ligase HERC1 n=1 Tax=Nilaparvata lugens TaxID=108931 RepID=UPI00193D766B
MAHSLLLLPSGIVQPNVAAMLLLLRLLQQLTKAPHIDSRLSSQANTPTAVSQQWWAWLVDMERAIGVLVGKCLRAPITSQQLPSPANHNQAMLWLESPLFAFGHDCTDQTMP